MRSLLASIVAVPMAVFANEVRAYEFRLIPHYLGYSNYSGVLAGGAMSFAFDISEKWQWEFGAFGGMGTKWRSGDFSVFAGPRFNIGDNRLNAFFIGFGVEYGNRVRCCESGNELSGYVEMGKRFSLNKSGTWIYSPSALLSSDGTISVLSIRPATFIYSF